RRALTWLVALASLHPRARASPVSRRPSVPPAPPVPICRLLGSGRAAALGPGVATRRGRGSMSLGTMPEEGADARAKQPIFREREFELIAQTCELLKGRAEGGERAGGAGG